MNTNEHQSHDLFEPTCTRCNEEQFGTEQEAAEEALGEREKALVLGANSWFAGRRLKAPTVAEWDAWNNHWDKRKAEREQPAEAPKREACPADMGGVEIHGWTTNNNDPVIEVRCTTCGGVIGQVFVEGLTSMKLSGLLAQVEERLEAHNESPAEKP